LSAAFVASPFSATDHLLHVGHRVDGDQFHFGVRQDEYPKDFIGERLANTAYAFEVEYYVTESVYALQQTFGL
jgi:hypothetical protein